MFYGQYRSLRLVLTAWLCVKRLGRLFEKANQSEEVSAGVVRSRRSAGILASRLTFRTGSAVPTRWTLRGRLEGFLPENSDGCCDIDRRRRAVGFAAHREAAHLAFDAALVAAVSARRHALLENFGEDSLMQRRPVLRGDGAEDRQLTAHHSNRVQE